MGERDDVNAEWEVTRILDRREVTRGRGTSLEYLLRWEGYGAHEDRWTNVKDMQAPDLIREYEEHRATLPQQRARRRRN